MPQSPKISFITTILNEQDSILPFLRSLAKQTRLPDEVIIVDAGSSDQTIKLIRQFQTRHSTILIYINIVEGINRSRGRNLAIKKAHYPIITVSDGGCVLDSNWLELITQPIRTHQAHIVAGAYQPVTDTPLKNVTAVLSSVFPDQISPDFLPSSRSLAFTRSVWKQVGGYPEHLNTAEDLVCASRLKTFGFQFYPQPQALVRWQPPATLSQALTTFFRYAQGDGLAGPDSPHFFKHLAKLILLFTLILTSLAFPPLLLLLPIGLLLWCFKKLISSYRYLQTPVSRLLFLPLALLLLPVTSLGFLSGIWHRYQTLFTPLQPQ
jgi:glycosyltransferase involved in cell wall biosynthesis